MIQAKSPCRRWGSNYDLRIKSPLLCQLSYGGSRTMIAHRRGRLGSGGSSTYNQGWRRPHGLAVRTPAFHAGDRRFESGWGYSRIGRKRGRLPRSRSICARESSTPRTISSTSAPRCSDSRSRVVRASYSDRPRRHTEGSSMNMTRRDLLERVGVAAVCCGRGGAG